MKNKDRWNYQTKQKKQHLPMEGSRFFGIFQLSETVLPVTYSTTGGPSDGSGRLTVKKLQCQ